MLGTPIRVVGPDHGLQVAGVKMLGFNAANAHKLLFSVIVLAGLYLLSKVLRGIGQAFGGDRQRTAFWARQGISLTTFVLGVAALVSIWFDNPSRLATGAAVLSAGLAFALQKVVTSFAGYFVILRGKTFNVGDRIKMGSVRGDVIALNFIQTVIMEMGEPPSEQQEDPGMWVQSRQYSGRIVTISNAQIFEDPVYNYSRDFQYIWEEMHIPVSYKDDRNRAEQILLDAVSRHTQEIQNLAKPELDKLKEQFFIQEEDLKPRVYLRITDNWVELAVRFLCGTHDIRGLKDRISRDILRDFDAAGIGIASGTYEIVGVPPIKVENVAMPTDQHEERKAA
ncbi:MAG TPA: mechanosensitive ion channel domain-containing protein [Acidobacteriaceae bacterium]|nr:mechanosensitive ion channel domain-containing protein [Acidobacteriaceae bacterium]